MRGSVLIGVLAGAACAMGAGLWYSLQYVHYEEARGVSAVEVAGVARPVSEYRAIDGESSPLNFRACFMLDAKDGIVGDGGGQGASAEGATPLIAPRQFDCFNARDLTQALRTGEAVAVIAAMDEPLGFDIYLAYYADGRAFMWRQINVCGAAKFGGNPLPAECRGRVAFQE